MMTELTTYTEYHRWNKQEIADDELTTKSESYAVRSISGKKIAQDAKPSTGVRNGLKNSCPHCRTKLVDFNYSPKPNEYVDYLFSYRRVYRRFGQGKFRYCKRCGWWFASQNTVTRTDAFGESYHNSDMYEAILKSFDIESDSTPLDVLRSYLVDNISDVAYLPPYKFEKLIADIYSDFYCCEVRHVGGPGDNGIDLYAVVGNREHAIQIKRRSDANKPEPVSTVREFIGALVSDGTAKGHIVTSSLRFTKGAKKLAANSNVAKHRIAISLKGLQDIHDMLRIINTPIDEIWKKF